MAFPGEDYVYRFHESQPTLLHARVLDIVVSPGSSFATVLAEWAYGTDAGVDLAGFSLFHLDPLGNIIWQASKILRVGTEAGPWIVQEATLAEDVGQHVVAGTAVHATKDLTILFSVGFENPDTPGDPPILRWSSRYQLNTFLVPPPIRISSITTMNSGGRYLISLYRLDDSYLIQIFSDGRIEKAWHVGNVHIQRLRVSAGTRDILAVGSYLDLGGVLIAFEGATMKRRWSSSCSDGSRPYRLLWTDVAEGAGVGSMLLIGTLFDGSGNELSPMMAAFTSGRLAWAAVPTLGDVPVRLRRLSSHRDVVVGVSALPETAAFSICGDATQQPWLAVLREDHSLEWQKFFRTVPPLTGSLESVVWATYDQILTGGSYTVGSGIPRGLYAASRSVVGRGKKRCAVEADVAFPEIQLREDAAGDYSEEAVFFEYALVLDDGPPLAAVPGCIVDEQD